MIHTESHGTSLDQNSRTTYVGSHPLDVIPEADILEKLQNNIEELEQLNAKLSFIMREIQTVMKI